MYEKELKERPILESLRRERGKLFFVEQQQMSVQQMEYQSMPVYNQQEYRWASVCGRRPPLLSAARKAHGRGPALLRGAGHRRCDRGHAGASCRLSSASPPGRHTVKRHKATPLAKLLLRHEHKRRDRLLVRAGTGEGDHPKAVQQRHAGLGRHVGPGPEDEEYVRAVFGRLCLSDQEMRILENELCVGDDGLCRLWVTKGELSDTANKDALEVRESAARQKGLNERFCADNAAMIEGSVRALATRIDTIFSSYFKHIPEPSRGGRIRPEAAWRLPVLDDTMVFLKDGEETEPEICVDLLLDASQSRMHSQEVLSAEGYMIARSLEKLHIPVRVCAFRSIRSYTVLEILKDWRDHDCRGLHRYFAGGWNRDGLAVETLGRLNDAPEMQGRQRILLVLTDGSPNDSTPLPSSGLIMEREYEGEAAVKSAQDAVKRLRETGVRVGAVFHGNTGHLENVHRIYGHAYVRIQKANQLAQGVGDLLLMLLREMRTD